MGSNAALANIALLAGSAAAPTEVAQEAVAELREVVPFASASLFSWDPSADRHHPLANLGYDDAVLDYLGNEHYERCRAYRLMRTADHRPMRWQDTPFDFAKSYPAEEVLTPAGYVQGLTACLYTQDGRYTGVLHLNSDTFKHPSDEGRDAIQWLQPILAAICDVTRAPAMLASWLEPEANAVALEATGELLGLPGRAAGRHLTPESPLARGLVTLTDRDDRDLRFYWRDEQRAWHRVRTIRVGDARILCELPAELPHGLTARELEVLTLVAQGRSNREIAEALVLSVRTVNTHVEHLLEKLQSSCRAECAARAAEEGLLGPLLPAEG